MGVRDICAAAADLELPVRLSSEDLVRLKQKRGYGIASSTRREAHFTPELKPQEKLLGGTKDNPPWSTEEDALISAAYAHSRSTGSVLNVQHLSELLGRSKNGIHCRAGELGVTFERGCYPREAVPIEQKPQRSAEALRAQRSARVTEWHKNNKHPLLGKPVSQEVRDKISAANKGRIVTKSEILKRLKTRSNNGTLAPNSKNRSWRAGWREVGCKRLFARSSWEANYARYLEFLQKNDVISDWEHEPETFWFEGVRRGTMSYLPDFRVKFPDGRVEFHECKGWMDQRSKTKIRRMKKYHPSVVLIVRDSVWFRSNSRQLSRLIVGWE